VAIAALSNAAAAAAAAAAEEEEEEDVVSLSLIGGSPTSAHKILSFGFKVGGAGGLPDCSHCTTHVSGRGAVATGSP
jgi:hypothetical protein